MHNRPSSQKLLYKVGGIIILEDPGLSLVCTDVQSENAQECRESICYPVCKLTLKYVCSTKNQGMLSHSHAICSLHILGREDVGKRLFTHCFLNTLYSDFWVAWKLQKNNPKRKLFKENQLFFSFNFSFFFWKRGSVDVNTYNVV